MKYALKNEEENIKTINILSFKDAKEIKIRVPLDIVEEEKMLLINIIYLKGKYHNKPQILCYFYTTFSSILNEDILYLGM